MPHAVHVGSLSRSYGDVQALDDVSFDVEAGECVAILGPNGAGKSTLLSILATIRTADSGVAEVAGHDVSTDPAGARRALGVVFQEPLVSKHLTAREVILHHGSLYGVPKATRQQRADELLAFVGLADRAGDRVDTFSGGMKRRLDLARVLVTEPEVLILDEPTTGLDIRGRARVHDHIRALADRGTTVIIATHDLDEAHRLARRVAILDRGKLLAYDTPSRLAHELGRRVVRIEFSADDASEAARKATSVLDGLGDVVQSGDAIELVLGDEDAEISAGRVVDVLESADVPHERILVREPNLGDVFLDMTGRSLDEDTSADAPEVAA